MARAWHAQAQKDRQWSASYAGKVMRHLELHVLPWIASLAMEAIKPTEFVRCFHRIRDRGNLEPPGTSSTTVCRPASPRATMRRSPIRTSWDNCYAAFVRASGARG